MNCDNLAIRLHIDGLIINERVFNALKRLMAGKENGERSSYRSILRCSSRVDYLIVDTNGLYVICPPSYLSHQKIVKPIDILGRYLLDAIEDGFTPYYSEDPVPVGNIKVLLSDGTISTSFKKASSWEWKRDGNLNRHDVIAYKTETVSEGSSMKVSTIKALIEQQDIIDKCVFQFPGINRNTPTDSTYDNALHKQIDVLIKDLYKDKAELVERLLYGSNRTNVPFKVNGDYIYAKTYKDIFDTLVEHYGFIEDLTTYTPRVNEECEIFYCDRWMYSFLVGFDPLGCEVFKIGNDFRALLIKDYLFRPIKTNIDS